MQIASTDNGIKKTNAVRVTGNLEVIPTVNLLNRIFPGYFRIHSPVSGALSSPSSSEGASSSDLPSVTCLAQEYADEETEPGSDKDRGDGVIDDDVLDRFNALMVTCLDLLVLGSAFCPELVYP
jgi:hypothetical protein